MGNKLPAARELGAFEAQLASVSRGASEAGAGARLYGVAITATDATERVGSERPSEDEGEERRQIEKEAESRRGGVRCPF